jgi:hypothetical protein
MNEKLSLFFEYAKLVQRVVMVVLTVLLVLVLSRSNTEIGALRAETRRIATIAENGCQIAEQTRREIYQQIEEIQKDGIKLHFRIW